MHAHGQRWPTPPEIPAPQPHSFICNEIQATRSFADQQIFWCSPSDGIGKDTRWYLFGSTGPASGFDAGFLGWVMQGWLCSLKLNVGPSLKAILGRAEENRVPSRSSPVRQRSSDFRF